MLMEIAMKATTLQESEKEQVSIPMQIVIALMERFQTTK